ncbi:MAG: hypothetical protein D6681_20590 [Calditrichaeota bacterium]|nr:MAG: hypothetical protein D6681_20590 [Calditrichota bacterium]
MVAVIHKIKSSEVWKQWEKEYLRRQKSDFFHNLKIYEALYEEARLLGVLPPANPLEGIEVKIKLAKALNAIATAGKDRSLP